MKALRLKLYQETACYKKPLAFKVGETYPLPPYATVKGMLHAMLGANEFIPMRLSIQGTYEAKMVDYQAHYFFKKTDVAEFPLVLDGLASKPYEYEHMTKMPLYMHLLYGVQLLIHVEAVPEVLEAIVAAIENGNTHWSLGRWEDLVRIDEYELVEVKEIEERIRLKYNAYILRDVLNSLETELNAVPYQLNWKYEIKNGIRRWEKIDVGYVLAVSGLEFDADDDVLQDQDGNLVFYNL
ncbi:type I-B CRISPR-associated protein Cas5b [Aneurinibacillus thermoaerophilus]|uniref:Type I-B CRISPR-associated protein Cas5b n=1 Tax=Aneurinibacillus thermoaerophilus TaxID=143495 RepID=A0ABX8YDT0_ANETH|nr:type I-B CRISPR-associated protein Cas5b [Aneurinibacillus thermoaerophilus]MED0675081.1 type I-B CRISPR-associated protein Cas5b [Aneurinibacillus thermoaerophilus]MED0677869.1 type I-B CRISPR-associated protein Cas5b [Aneurinibacillus thermoaerophilus]MED0756530.1 type I-B CRISPR-associated protein Cas5b [Aneurinibacillus thermoaerophilus]MED0761556.1 type I-B CRISPR-associated protein Cas5b [Aneurinibacillus thermoaerophilus]MED0764425.1 type I-B CRISPR-associated protein Cas5b [Aneurini